MKQAMLLKLAPSPEHHTALFETMHAFNAGATYVASVAEALKTANKFELQKMTYGELRTTYHLPAQLAIRAISKASEAYKRDKSIKPTFKPEGAIAYDPRVMAFKGLGQVSLITLSGRVLVPFRMGGYQESRFDRIKGQAHLSYGHGIFYLATDSEGETFSGEVVEKTRKRMHALRGRLQKRGTQSARRHLKKLSGREKRF